MAVTSIWPIKGRVDKVINYARNPEKTHDKEKLSELHEIEGVVEYAADEMKTEKRAYVTCLHLHSEETAAQEFMETKRLMHNEGGRSCYHGYQSFKADEVDADTAHSIGVALARELWGDRFFSCACISFAFSKPFCAHSGSFFSSMTPRKSVR